MWGVFVFLRLAVFVEFCYNVYAVLPHTCNRLAAEGGEQMDHFMNFLSSVGAGVVTYLICKWLDRRDRH